MEESALSGDVLKHTCLLMDAYVTRRMLSEARGPSRNKPRYRDGDQP